MTAMASQNDSAALQSLMLSLCLVKCCLILYALSLQIGHFQVPSLNSVGKFRKVGHTTLVRESSECSGRLSEVVEGIEKLWKEKSENVVWHWPGGSPEWLVVEGSNVLEIEKEITENVVWLWPGGSPEWLVAEVPKEGSNVLEEFVNEISENVGWSGPPPLFSSHNS